MSHENCKLPSRAIRNTFTKKVRFKIIIYNTNKYCNINQINKLFLLHKHVPQDLLNQLKIKTPTDIEHFQSCNHQKWLHIQILDSETVKNVQSDPQTTEMWPI